MSFPLRFRKKNGVSSSDSGYTHVVVWLAFDQAKISKAGREAINEARMNGKG
jgi:hypothetical protein